MTRIAVMVAVALSGSLLSGCQTLTSTSNQNPPAIQSLDIVSSNELANQQAEALFEALFNESVMASPEYQTYLGLKSNQDQWDDYSPQGIEQDHQRSKAQLARLLAFDPSQLTGQTQISYQLLKQRLEHQIATYEFRYHSYPVTQMYGFQSGTPAFLINQHNITNEADALAYISRLKGIEKRFADGIEQLMLREQQGVIAPEFTFDYALNDSKNVISGAPFDAGQDSPLWADFKKKVKALKLPETRQQALFAQAETALTEEVQRGYQQLIAFLSAQQQRAQGNYGSWHLPNGEAYYQLRLKQMTTTDLSAAQIHQLGLAEVARIHAEMQQIMDKVGFNGDLQAFFEFMRTDPQFYLSSDKAGRDQYIAQATAVINDFEARLDEVFNIKPKAPLKVKRVEPFREKSAGKAFYQRPALDGSRPGVYYANLYKMDEMPTYQLEALAFHEGIPGHHMQLAIAQELQDLPKFRRLGGYTAYSEGWGLYSEYLPKEMGYYQDPYSDFGRLAMELWRACRLVVDTGIHQQRWSREQAIDYLATNTPNPHGDVVKAIERYFVMPGQATAYMVGMLRILELRQQAKNQLGDKFSLPHFHDAILANGPVPLDVLEQQVDQYILINL
ncbi:MAG: DUF885 family protein [Ferrimonas sp.]